MRIPMILPVMDPQGRARPGCDVRLPGDFGGECSTGARIFGGSQTTAECPDGRHVWDAIENRGLEEETSDDDADTVRQPFKLVLTCVRCGVIIPLSGVLELPVSGGSGVVRVIPKPLRSGALVAQQVYPWDPWDLWGDGDPLAGTWAVFRAGAEDVRAGSIFQEVGPRGRKFYTGRFYSGRIAGAGPAEVQGPTVAACLRKLARLA